MKNIVDGYFSLDVHSEPVGYIAGLGSGIATRGDVPAKISILLYECAADKLVARTESMRSGNYLLAFLDPNKRYRLIAIDPKGEYQSLVWDNIKPAQDLSVKAQWELWRQMTSAEKQL